MLEGCDRHLDSRSDCLDTLPAATVIDAVDTLLSNEAAPRIIMLKQSENPSTRHG
jgi:hypothetical protein